MAGQDRNEHSGRYGSRDVPTTMSHAPVATRTLSIVEKRGGSGRRWFLGLILAGGAAAAAYSVLRLPPRSFAPSAPPTAPARPAVVAPTAATIAAPSTVSFEASASPGEATLYLDGKPLPSNPFVGRIASDDVTHLLRAEAPGYVSTTRSFLANREVAIILALAKSNEPAPAEAKRVVRPTVGASPAAPGPVAQPKSTADDCSISPYYVDDRNIKVVKPECRRAIQSP
jgi:eukaryotic-like serine/threonine-protein kinase